VEQGPHGFIMGMRPGLGLRNGGAGRGAEPLCRMSIHLPGQLADPAPCCAHRVTAAPPVTRGAADAMTMERPLSFQRPPSG